MFKNIILVVAFLSGLIFALVVSKTQGINLVKAKTSLTSYMIQAEASQKMIVYELSTVEKIKQEQELSPLWKLISSANVDVEMLVPVRFAYYIDFNEGFDIEKSANGYIVVVPSLKSYTPAVDVSAISFQVNEAPWFYNTKSVENKIKEQLTGYLNGRSEDLKKNYYSQARASVEKVVQKWIISSEDFKSLPNTAVQIVFKDEHNKFGNKN